MKRLLEYICVLIALFVFLQPRYLKESKFGKDVTAWESEIATYERDSGKTFDDEIKI